MLATTSVWTSKVTPPIVSPGSAIAYPTQSESISAQPLYQNSHRGEKIRKKRSVRQPSRKVRRWGRRVRRPSGDSVIGICCIWLAEQARLDDHLRGEFHARALQFETVERVRVVKPRMPQ